MTREEKISALIAAEVHLDLYQYTDSTPLIDYTDEELDEVWEEYMVGQDDAGDTKAEHLKYMREQRKEYAWMAGVVKNYPDLWPYHNEEYVKQKLNKSF